MWRQRRPHILVAAYMLVVAFVFGLLVDRRPPVEPVAPAFASGATALPEPLHLSAVPAEHQGGGAALGLRELFRPSPETARRLLEQAFPLFWALSPEHTRQLDVYGPTRPPAQGLMESLFPFLAGAGSGLVRHPAGSPPRVQGGGPSGSAAPPPVAGFDDGGARSDRAPPPDAAAGEGVGRAPTGRDNPPAESEGAGTLRDGLPLVGIYHTHEYESYVSEFPGKSFPSKESLMHVATGDPDHNIIRVGRQLARALFARGVGVVHSPSPNSGDNYLGAYLVSLRTASHILERFPSVQVLLDIHRDDAPRAESTADVGGLPVARIAIVIGRGDPDLPQPLWEKNMAFAQQLGEAMDQRYTGLFRGIITRPARYNQHLRPGALLLEIGSATNTMEESLRSADLLAAVLAERVRGGQYPRP